MVEKVALQVAEVWCWGPVTLCNFLSNLFHNAPWNEKQVCECTLVKTAVKLRDKLLEGWYAVQWCCQLLQSIAKSRAEFYFVQGFAQHKNCETTHVTQCNSPAACLATALWDKLLRKLQCNRAFRFLFRKTSVQSFKVHVRCSNWILTKFSDEGGRVVPHAAVEANTVISQFVQHLVELKWAHDGLNQHTGFDGTHRDTQLD